jgi:hypothetical protein
MVHIGVLRTIHVYCVERKIVGIIIARVLLVYIEDGGCVGYPGDSPHTTVLIYARHITSMLCIPLSHTRIMHILHILLSEIRFTFLYIPPQTWKETPKRKITVTSSLKGHGNDADFLRFLNKSVRHMAPLHHISSRSDFGFEFPEIFVIGESLILRVAKSGSRRVGESAIEC